jgi:hypothetical protein
MAKKKIIEKLYSKKLSGVRFRCQLCGDIVGPDDRTQHLIDHASAYGSVEDQEKTASFFDAVEE